MTARPSKPCVVCGRTIEWRKKWERDWDEVRYCSKACRSRKLSPEDVALEQAVLDLLARRQGGASICPSEAARTVDEHAWRELMEPVRMAARRLVDAGRIEIIQRGRVVDPSTAKGPMRLRLKPR
ncbi:MAG: DUF2256 and DUF3253 domain-containing protein [Planctomycetota bacterium]